MAIPRNLIQKTATQFVNCKANCKENILYINSYVVLNALWRY